MKLGYARIFVNDLDGMAEFYANTRRRTKICHDAENAHAGFETGDCTLILEGPARQSLGEGVDSNGKSPATVFTALADTPCAPTCPP
ncbi:MAG: hypothetical protein R3E76_16030 [Planctomycetota bacterium]